MTLTPFPANCLAEHHFPTLQKHGAWTGTGFVCADDLPLSDDEDEEQAAFNFICKCFVETAASRLFSYWVVYSVCIPMQVQGPTTQVSSDKHVGFGKETKGCSGVLSALGLCNCMQLPHLATLRIYELEWYTQCGQEMFLAGREGSLFPFSIRSQSTTERRKGFGRLDDILAYHCVVAWYETSGSSFGLKQAQASFLQTTCRNLTRKMKIRRKLTSSNLVGVDELLESCFISFCPVDVLM